MIPMAAEVPGTGITSYADREDIVRGLLRLVQFPPDIATYSHGMCAIDLSIRVVADPLPESVFFSYGGQHIIFPRYLASHLGDADEYDGLAVLNPPNLMTGSSYRGLGGTSGDTPYLWVKIGTDERTIACHEWGHAMTAYLRTTTGEYDNFPSCGDNPAMHCNDSYGFASDIEDGWLEGFLSGTLPDGTGINADGWNVGTLTERGERRLPQYREHRTPWGLLPPIRLTSE